jgi:hypothetical protein
MQIAPTDGAAADTTESLQTILVLVRSMANSAGTSSYDPETRSMINSISVERHRNEAVLTATIPAALVQRTISDPQQFRALPVPQAGKDNH